MMRNNLQQYIETHEWQSLILRLSLIGMQHLVETIKKMFGNPERKILIGIWVGDLDAEFVNDKHLIEDFEYIQFVIEEENQWQRSKTDVGVNSNYVNSYQDVFKKADEMHIAYPSGYSMAFLPRKYYGIPFTIVRTKIMRQCSQSSQDHDRRKRHDLMSDQALAG